MLKALLSLVGRGRLEKVWVPPNRQPRHKCPFYGFAQQRATGALLDQRGNNCGLSYFLSPCEMEMAGKTPAWSECRFSSTGKNLFRKFSGVQVYPREIGHEEVDAKASVGFMKWAKYVMHEATPRPEPQKSNGTNRHA